MFVIRRRAQRITAGPSTLAGPQVNPVTIAREAWLEDVGARRYPLQPSVAFVSHVEPNAFEAMTYSTYWNVASCRAVPVAMTNCAPMPLAAVAGKMMPSSGGTTQRTVACWLNDTLSMIAPAV